MDIDELKAILRNKAWDPLPIVLSLKAFLLKFKYQSQYFFIPQNKDNTTIVKHCFLTDSKVTFLQVRGLAQGTAYEIQGTTGVKVVERMAFQSLLEQMVGTQFRHFLLSLEKKRPPFSSMDDEQDVGWDLSIRNGERDTGISNNFGGCININTEGCLIKGLSKKLVQRALDSLTIDGASQNLLPDTTPPSKTSTTSSSTTSSQM